MLKLDGFWKEGRGVGSNQGEIFNFQLRYLFVCFFMLNRRDFLSFELKIMFIVEGYTLNTK